jgi:hypothetical protein
LQHAGKIKIVKDFDHSPLPPDDTRTCAAALDRMYLDYLRKSGPE